MKKKEIRNLPCRLTEEELIQRSMRNCEQQKLMEQLEGEKANAAKKFGKLIEDAKMEIRLLSEVVLTRLETREVHVELTANYATKMMDIVRQDTGELVDSRPMTEQELQRGFEFQGKADA